MTIAITVFEFVVLLFSAVLHEVAHGIEAKRLGDDTAERAGRLTLNPLKHLDLFGSLIMPALLYLATQGQFFFAAAKPVPYDPRNMKDPRTGGAKVALAGPGMNLLLAVIFAGVLRVAVYFNASVVLIDLLGSSATSTFFLPSSTSFPSRRSTVRACFLPYCPRRERHFA